MRSRPVIYSDGGEVWAALSHGPPAPTLARLVWHLAEAG